MTFDFVAMAETLAKLLHQRREQFMVETLTAIIGPGCPKSAEDIMTVLWFRGMEAELTDHHHPRLVVRRGAEVVFDGELPTMDFGRTEYATEWRWF